MNRHFGKSVPNWWEGLKFGMGRTWSELAVSAEEMCIQWFGGSLRVPEVCLLLGCISSAWPSA